MIDLLLCWLKILTQGIGFGALGLLAVYITVRVGTLAFFKSKHEAEKGD